MARDRVNWLGTQAEPFLASFAHGQARRLVFAC
jgi:hypothetical protein